MTILHIDRATNEFDPPISELDDASMDAIVAAFLVAEQAIRESA